MLKILFSLSYQYILLLIFILEIGLAFSYEDDLIRFSSEGEKIQFERTLEQIFYEEHFLYPLYGYKAVACAGFKESPCFEDLINFDDNYFGYLDWVFLKHNLEKFCNKDFILCKEQHFNRKNYSLLFLLNKKEFIKCCNQNIDLFRKYTAKDFCPMQAIDNLEKGKCGILKIINKNELLLGILLGYGVENSTKFYKFKLNYKPITYNLVNNKNFSMHDLKRITIPCSPLSRHNPLSFAAEIDSQETQFLIKKYTLCFSYLSSEFNSDLSIQKILSLIYSSAP